MSGPAAIKFPKGLPSRPQYGERARLFVAQGPDKGSGFCLVGERLVIGRDDADVALVDPNVSRHHVELCWSGTSYAAKDLGSANGLLVNRRRVMDAELRNGDVILIGASVIEVVPPGVAKGRLSSGEPKQLTQAEIAHKAAVAKKRTIVVFVVFLLFLLAYSATETKVETFRERGKIDFEEEAKRKAPLTAKEKKQKIQDAREAIKEVITGGETTTGQRQDANRFFKAGMREYNNRNYRRAIISFETALTVDPSHNMAKLYLKSAKRDFEKEIEATFKAAVKAQKALRFSEARMHYENVLRFLENNKLNERYVNAEKALKEMEKMEAETP